MNDVSTNTTIKLLPLPSQSPFLSSFSDLRSRNLQTLYGSTDIIGRYSTEIDKSPKGSVDQKIRPLVDLINCHPDYVTLSSCSGRVALFDPGVDDERNSNRLQLESLCEANNDFDGTNSNGDADYGDGKKNKSTKLSGKGRGKWIFVTHDILPGLGVQICSALRKVGDERALHHQSLKCREETRQKHPPITLKHEPPLLHIAASSLESGRRMLHIVKSLCACRESGLVVTDGRVTVEVRTCGTLLCLPIFVTANSNGGDFELHPGEEYLMALAEMANERMAQNEVMMDKLYTVMKKELFHERDVGVFTDKMSVSEESATCPLRTNTDYEVTMHPLPPLNIWKTAAVALPCSMSNDSQRSTDDLDVLAFGGQGTGPVLYNKKENTSCQRWDAVFRLKRRSGTWSDQWETVKLNDTNNSNEFDLNTNAGTFRVSIVNNFGRREGHAACVLPSISSRSIEKYAGVIFGGRRGGPLSPTSDLFLFAMHEQTDGSDVPCGVMCKPVDVRGELPGERYGHSMTSLSHTNLDEGEVLALVAGGTGVCDIGSTTQQVALSSVYTLSRVQNDSSETYHFVWAQLADMKVPRAYHTAIAIPLESKCVLAFGGLSYPYDPFDSIQNEQNIDSEATFEILGCSQSTLNANANEMSYLSPVMGCSGITFDVPNTTTAALVVGGAKLHDTRSSNMTKEALHIFEWSCTGSITKANAKVIHELGSNDTSSGANLGVCVHHCLVSLPKVQGEQTSDFVSSVVSVGGGVPSFSFGQSFAK